MIFVPVINKAKWVNVPSLPLSCVTILQFNVYAVVKVQATESKNTIPVWGNQEVSAEINGARHYEATIIIDMLAIKFTRPGAK